MRASKLSPIVLAVVLLLGSAACGAHAASTRAKRMMRQGDALAKLTLNPANMSKKSTSTQTDVQAFMSLADLNSRTLTQDGLKEKDKIARLPGQPPCVDFLQYGGYVTVDEKAGRALYYYFAEAPDAASKPLLLWLNGGPGCSSIGIGAMEELGPFRVMSDGKTLFRNPYAWNKVANVLFLESPAGVGFSYSNTTDDYRMNGDAHSAEDAYVFLVNWLERFPEYKTRDFYITGESYAGHYVPQLAHNIYYYNQLPSASVINLKGIAIGNPVINGPTDNQGKYDFFWTHALISDELHTAVDRYCNFTSSCWTANDECTAAVEEAESVGNKVDLYNIYTSFCVNRSLTKVPRSISISNFDPCSEVYVDAYLNDPAVQEALHANVTRLDHPWQACRTIDWQDRVSTVLPLLKEFVANGMRVLVYSGDTDAVVPVTGTRYSVNALKLPVTGDWQPWEASGEVGGFSEVYMGVLTLATVRGAGHVVPSFQPQRALVMIQAFLEGNPLPLYSV